MMLWRYATGQAAGNAHAKLGKPLQDRMGCFVEHGTLIAVVADGAGSADLAHVGAEIAVDSMSSIARLGVRAGRDDHRDVLREGARLSRERLIEAARERKVAPRDLACTLLAVIVAPMGGAALQIGDGVIVTGVAQGMWNWVFWPQKGEYANTTFFLSDERSLENAALTDLRDDVGDIALMSDGLEPLALHFASRTAHEPFFRSVFSPLHAATGSGENSDLSKGLAGLLTSDAVRSRTDDDTSLVLATRRNA